MAVRYLKIVFVASMSLLCLAYAINNVVNLEACFGAIAYVAGGADHAVYASSFMPDITSPALIWLLLVIIVGLEFAAGLTLAKGAWDLWGARGDAAAFNGAKNAALVGCGLTIVIWFTLFGVFGGAVFQMWQTQIGSGSMDDAFQFFVSGALIFLLVNAEDS